MNDIALSTSVSAWGSFKRSCAKCGIAKPAEGYRLRKSPSTGRLYRGKVCKTCQYSLDILWKKANPDVVKKYMRDWRHKNPERSKAVSLQYYYDNRDSALKRQKIWRAANPDRIKHNNAINSLRKYGLTIQQKADMLARQGGVCAICHCVDTSKRPWHVDHCHKTGRVRGILCTHCNVMLGRARDSSEILRNAASYLESIANYMEVLDDYRNSNS